jgi:hypothetical protein
VLWEDPQYVVHPAKSPFPSAPGKKFAFIVKPSFRNGLDTVAMMRREFCRVFVVENPLGEWVVGVCSDVLCCLQKLQQTGWGRRNGPWSLVEVSEEESRDHAMERAEKLRRSKAHVLDVPLSFEGVWEGDSP